MLPYQQTPSNTEITKEVVLLHGFLESPSIWDYFLRHANKKTTRYTTVSLPNHYPEEEAPYRTCLTKQAEVLHRTLVQAQVKKPILVGHSLGGYLALAYIEKYAAYSSGIVLINSTCFADDLERQTQRTRAINLVGQHLDAFVRMAIRNLFPPSDLERYATSIEDLITEAKTRSIPAIQAALKAMRDRKDRTQILKNYPGEKWFIYGKNDPLISKEASLKAISKSNCPSIALETGHMAWLEDREGLQKALLEVVG